MAGRLTKEARLDRERSIWELRTKEFLPPAEIGRRLGIPASTVGKIIADLSRRYTDDLKDKVLTYKSVHLDRLEWAQQQAIEEWQKSKQPKTTLTQKTETSDQRGAMGKAGELSEITQKHEEQTGDPRYLQIFMQAMGDQRKILGIDAPTKVAVTDTKGQDAQQVLSAEEMFRRFQAMATKITPLESPSFPQLTDGGIIDGEAEVEES